MNEEQLESARPAKSETEASRVSRLLAMAREIRQNPRQSRERLCERFHIGKSQFYKDRQSLAAVGFRFEYGKSTGFRVIEDRLTPIVGLSLTDRLILMFALEQLCASGEGTLAALAVDVGRKLAGGLESPFREHLQDCFDRQVTEEGFGVNPKIFGLLRDAIASGERLRILYTRAEDWTTRWRDIDPRHLYLRERTLYLYARTADENPPQWKVFRVSRISEAVPAGLRITWKPDEDGGFWERQRNAFLVFLGDRTRKITLRFRGEARNYVRERRWHSSQKLEDEGESLLFSVEVASPEEVIRWARQFGSEVEVVAVEPEGEDA